MLTCAPPAHNGISTCVFNRRKDGKKVRNVVIEGGLCSAKAKPQRRHQNHSQKAECSFDLCQGALCAPYMSQSTDIVIEWHKEQWNIRDNSLHEATKQLVSLPKIFREKISNIMCIECIIAKKAPTNIINRRTISQLGIVHTDVLRAVGTKSIGNRSYVVGNLDDFTAYSTALF